MAFTYTPNYKKIRYDAFSWLTGMNDPGNKYAHDDHGKQHEEYVKNLHSHGIWFITGWERTDTKLFVDNYGNVWTQERIYVPEQEKYLTKCPYKKKDYTHSTHPLPDQAIDKIVTKDWPLLPVNTTSDILKHYEVLKQTYTAPTAVNSAA